MRVVRFEDIALANVRVGKCWQSRRYAPADIAELAESIEVVGLLEPIIVAPSQEPGQYELVGRHRHFLAVRRLAADAAGGRREIGELESFLGWGR